MDDFSYDAIYLANVIDQVIKKEYPIHFELLCKRIACLFGNQKATVKVRNSADFVMNNKLSNSVERKGNFCWIKGTNIVSARIPHRCNSRPISYISTKEITEAMFKIASKIFGIAMEDLFVLIARAYGFNRTGGNLTLAMQQACEYLINTDRVKNTGGKVLGRNAIMSP